MTFQRAAGFRHLHEADHAFIHTCSAAGGHDDQRKFLRGCKFNDACDLFTHNGTHAGAEKTEIHYAERIVNAVEFCVPADDRIGQPGLLFAGGKFVCIGGDAFKSASISLNEPSSVRSAILCCAVMG